MSYHKLRRFLFWGHLVVGVTVGLLILILAITGFLMSFETQIIGAVERSMVRERTNGRSEVLAPESMMALIESSNIKGQPSSLNYTNHPEDPVILLVDRGNQQLFHPASGEFLGKGATGTRTFFQTVLSIHRWLTFSTPRPETRKPSDGTIRKPITWKEIGGNLQAAACLGFLGLLTSGLLLWIPKKLSRPAFKAVLLPNPRLKGRARDWTWHNLTGFWAAPLIFAITLTGLIMAYPWANQLLFRTFGEQAPLKQGSAGRSDQEKPPAAILTTGLDRVAEVARSEMPDWKAMSLELPVNDSKPYSVTVTDAGRGRPDRRVKLLIDRKNFQILTREGFDKLSPATRLRQSIRWTHTGEIGGLFGQLLAALTCLATMLLIWTGYALTWRRLIKNRGLPSKVAN